jgi:hypothetical protein
MDPYVFINSMCFFGRAVGNALACISITFSY